MCSGGLAPSLPAPDEQDLALLGVEFHFFGQGALPAEPNYLLLDVCWQPPGLRAAYRQSVDLAAAEALELGFAFRVGTLTER